MLTCKAGLIELVWWVLCPGRRRSSRRVRRDGNMRYWTCPVQQPGSPVDSEIWCPSGNTKLTTPLSWLSLILRLLTADSLLNSLWVQFGVFYYFILIFKNCRLVVEKLRLVDLCLLIPNSLANVRGQMSSFNVLFQTFCVCEDSFLVMAIRKSKYDEHDQAS